MTFFQGLGIVMILPRGITIIVTQAYWSMGCYKPKTAQQAHAERSNSQKISGRWKVAR